MHGFTKLNEFKIEWDKDKYSIFAKKEKLEDEYTKLKLKKDHVYRYDTLKRNFSEEVKKLSANRQEIYNVQYDILLRSQYRESRDLSEEFAYANHPIQQRPIHSSFQ